MASPPPIPCIPGNRGPSVIIVEVLFTVIATILLGLRIYARLRIVSAGLGWDDAFMVAAWAFLFPTVSVSLKQTQLGLGRHIGCVSPANIIYSTKIENIAEIPLILSTIFSRVSVCLFLLRLFKVNISWRWTLYTIIALTTAVNISSATIILLQCHPRGKLWNPEIPGTCWKREIQVAIGQAQGVVSIVLDLILSALPVYCMWKIKLSWKIKAAICGLMSLGVLTAICVLVRTILLAEIEGEDISWDTVPPIIWANLEAQIAVCVACIATLRPLFVSRPSKQSGQSKTFSESQRHRHYVKFPNDPQSQSKWTGGDLDGTGTSYSIKATGDHAHDDDIPMENVRGIKRVIDVDVTV